MAVFLLVWYMFTDGLHIADTSMLPGPVTVLKSFIRKFYDPNPDGATMMQHLASSLKVALSGYVMGVVVGIPLGISMAWFKTCDYFVRPLFDLIRPIPGLAWIPLMIILFGIGLFSKAMVIFLSSLTACIINAYSGVKQTKTVHVWVGQIFGASHLELLFRVGIPTSLPMVMTGMRVALGSSWSALIAAELLASTRGLGFMIQQSRGLFRPDIIIAGMIAIGITGAVLTGLLGLLERVVLKGGRW